METGGELASAPRSDDRGGMETGGQLERVSQVERVERVIIESIPVPGP